MQLAGSSGGVGLRGMKERLRQLGGSLSLESGETGTTVTASLQLSNSPAVENEVVTLNKTH